MHHAHTQSTTSETFAARLWIDCYWMPSAKELEHPDAGSEWAPVPNFQLTNATEIKRAELISGPSLKEMGGGGGEGSPATKKWHAVVEMEAVFAHKFDLHAFPLDCQALTGECVMRVRSAVYTRMRYSS